MTKATNLDNNPTDPSNGQKALERADLMVPTEDQAFQFALILGAGVPSEEAIRYFIPGGDEWTPSAVAALHDRWMRSARVNKALTKQMGAAWQEMSIEQRIKHAVDKNYTEMAYFLFSHNYATVQGADKVKADTCRATLEAKLAGMAGKLDPLANFLEDFFDKRGKAEVAGVPKSGPAKVKES